MQSMQTTSGYVNQSCSCELPGRVPWIQGFLFFLVSQLFLFVFVLLDILCGLLCWLMEAMIVHSVKSQTYCDLDVILCFDASGLFLLVSDLTPKIREFLLRIDTWLSSEGMTYCAGKVQFMLPRPLSFIDRQPPQG